MATQIELDEFTTNSSDFLQRVRSLDDPVDLVDHGEIVARLLPVRRVSDEERAKRWAALDELAAKIGKLTDEEVSAVEMIRDVRREL
jgi:antitoxin (DNA-binding transcriptional repressor) of toxin-antitoxin stability system